MVIYEERNISPLMTDTNAFSAKYLCQVQIKKDKFQSSKHYLNTHFARILECFYPFSSKVTNQTLIELQGIKETSELIISPLRFTVEFNDQFANISLLTPR